MSLYKMLDLLPWEIHLLSHRITNHSLLTVTVDALFEHQDYILELEK